VDTLGNLLALKVTAADEQERAQVAELAERLQEVTGRTVEISYVDQGYTGEDAAQQAEQAGITLTVAKHKEAKRGFVLLRRRWVVERTFGWLGRFRRLARDYERRTQTLAGWHWLAFVVLLLATAGLKVHKSLLGLGTSRRAQHSHDRPRSVRLVGQVTWQEALGQITCPN
jgi:transposase